MSQTLRLFWALDLPPGVRQSLEEVQGRLKKTKADVRWVRPAGIHLTLKFLGQVAAERVAELAAAVSPAALECPVLKLWPASAGCFPRLKSPRVVWLGLDGDVAALEDLARRIEAVHEPLGFAREGRPFSPHLTLGRVKSGRGRAALIEAVAGLNNYQGPAFKAEELILFRSELKPDGAVYTPLERAALGGG